jgi:hypothetical protein
LGPRLGGARGALNTNVQPPRGGPSDVLYIVPQRHDGGGRGGGCSPPWIMWYASCHSCCSHWWGPAPLSTRLLTPAGGAGGVQPPLGVVLYIVPQLLLTLVADSSPEDSAAITLAGGAGGVQLPLEWLMILFAACMLPLSRLVLAVHPLPVGTVVLTPTHTGRLYACVGVYRQGSSW